MLDFSLELHVKKEFLAAIPFYTAKRLIFLRTAQINLPNSP